MDVFTATLPWSHAEELPWKSLSRFCHGGLYRDPAWSNAEDLPWKPLSRPGHGDMQRKTMEVSTRPCHGARSSRGLDRLLSAVQYMYRHEYWAQVHKTSWT